MRRTIIYHEDLDGICAAAIALKHARAHGVSCSFVPMDHGRPMEWMAFDENWFKHDRDECWLLDFSFEPLVMAKLRSVVGNNLVWIDHHKTAIEAAGEFADLKGVRDIADAACLLTWHFCFPNDPAPDAVRFIADRDTWTFARGDQTRWACEILAHEIHDAGPLADVWKSLLMPRDGRHGSGTLGRDVLEIGRYMYEARIRLLRAMARKYGETCSTQFQNPASPGGLIWTFSINHPPSGDLGQVIKDMGHAIAHVFVDQYRPGGGWVRKHTLYSDTVDVSAIAAQYGGGGHRGAAGWIQVLPQA